MHQPAHVSPSPISTGAPKHPRHSSLCATITRPPGVRVRPFPRPHDPGHQQHVQGNVQGHARGVCPPQPVFPGGLHATPLRAVGVCIRPGGGVIDPDHSRVYPAGFFGQRPSPPPTTSRSIPERVEPDPIVADRGQVVLFLRDTKERLRGGGGVPLKNCVADLAGQGRRQVRRCLVLDLARFAFQFPHLVERVAPVAWGVAERRRGLL